MRRTRAGHAGFTLIELLVTIALMAVLLRLAVPSFQSTMLSNKLASYSNDFVGAVQFARSEAVKRNAQITLCRSADGSTCATSGSFEQGWIVMCKALTATPTVCNSTGTEVLVLHKEGALSSDYRFTTTSGTYSLVFPASGVGATQVTAKVCRATPTAGSQERQIEVTVSGRTSVTKTTTGTCS
jgi:type IV fimbrial biogenesis protein FimT